MGAVKPSVCRGLCLGCLIVGYIEKTLSVPFAHIGAKRTKNAVWGVSPLRRRRGLRALDQRKLLKKFDQNFCEWSGLNFEKVRSKLL